LKEQAINGKTEKKDDQKLIKKVEQNPAKDIKSAKKDVEVKKDLAK